MRFTLGLISGLIVATAATSYLNWPRRLGEDRVELIPPQMANLECNEYGTITLNSWSFRGFGGGRKDSAAIYLDDYVIVDLPRIFGCEDLTP